MNSYWIGRSNGSSSGMNTNGSSLNPNSFIFLDGGGLRTEVGERRRGRRARFPVGTCVSPHPLPPPPRTGWPPLAGSAGTRTRSTPRHLFRGAPRAEGPGRHWDVGERTRAPPYPHTPSFLLPSFSAVSTSSASPTPPTASLSSSAESAGPGRTGSLGSAGLPCSCNGDPCLHSRARCSRPLQEG